MSRAEKLEKDLCKTLAIQTRFLRSRKKSPLAFSQARDNRLRAGRGVGLTSRVVFYPLPGIVPQPRDEIKRFPSDFFVSHPRLEFPSDSSNNPALINVFFFFFFFFTTDG